MSLAVKNIFPFKVRFLIAVCGNQGFVKSTDVSYQLRKIPCTAYCPVYIV